MFRSILEPSLRAALKPSLVDSIVGGMQVVHEIQDSTAPVTNVLFGQDHSLQDFILLAVARYDGTLTTFKVPKTEMEKLGMQEGKDMVYKLESGLHFSGHRRCITSMCFNRSEDVLITVSLDKTMKFWCVSTGACITNFSDSSALSTFAFMPFDNVCILANASVLRLLNYESGQVLQKVPVESQVRCLSFDEIGVHMFAGTADGSIYVFEAKTCAEKMFTSYTSTIKQTRKMKVADGAITSLTCVPARGKNPAHLIFNALDSKIHIVDLIYDTPNVGACSAIKNLSVRHRLDNPQSSLPITSTFCRGRVISGSEKDNSIHFWDHETKAYSLDHHNAPVLAVICNVGGTVMASADVSGRVALWRAVKMDHEDAPAYGN